MILTVKTPVPARFPAYRIVSETGEQLATVPITASGKSHKLAAVMAAGPELLAALKGLLKLAESYAETIDGEWGTRTGSGRNIQQLEEAGELDEEIIAARAAIAKAEGG